MPKYVNTSTDLVVVGNTALSPNQTVETVQWMPTPLPTGVTKLADAPFYDPIILSQKITGAVTVAIPADVTGNYKVSVYCTAGDVSVKVNSASSTAKLLGTGMLWEAQCLSRTINDIRFTVSGGTAYLTVEKV